MSDGPSQSYISHGFELDGGYVFTFALAPKDAKRMDQRTGELLADATSLAAEAFGRIDAMEASNDG